MISRYNQHSPFPRLRRRLLSKQVGLIPEKLIDVALVLILGARDARNSEHLA